MGAATTAAPYGFWATNPTKKLAHWVYLLGQPLSRNRVFQNFSGEPPLKAGNRITFEDEKGAIQDVVVTSISGKATGAYYNRFNVKDSITGREYKINLGDETKVSKNTVLIYREE